MKKHLLVKTALSGLFATLCTVGIVSFPGCQKQDYDYSEKDDLDPALLNSPELEEYIIAGADFQQTLNIFKDEINKIDFSKPEFIKNIKEGKEIYLSISVNIREKVQRFNDKKKLLFAKHPQFASLTENARNNYFRVCLRNSLNVNKKLLELGININHPLTKGGVSENYGSMDDVLKYLANWMEKSNYVEIVVIKYADGTIATYVDDRNTATEFHLPLETKNNDGKRYFPAGGSNSPVTYIAHTHKSGSEPQGKDESTIRAGITSAIYYDGAFHEFGN